MRGSEEVEVVEGFNDLTVLAVALYSERDQFGDVVA
jgi:hypothetical protein